MTGSLPPSSGGYNNIFTEIVARHLFNNEIGMENLDRLIAVLIKTTEETKTAQSTTFPDSLFMSDTESQLMEAAETCVKSFVTKTYSLSGHMNWDWIIAEAVHDRVLRDILQTAVDYIDWMQIGKEVVGHFRDQQKNKEKDGNA